jgi:hypothetical protein
MIARPRTRSFAVIVLTLGLALVGACDRGGSSNTPGDGGGDGGKGTPAAAEDGGKDYVYAEQFTLIANTKIKFEQSSNQGQGAAEIQVRSEITGKPSGDKLEVHGRVLEVLGYKGSGELDPEFQRKQAQEAGKEFIDIAVQLGKAESWQILDRKGNADDEASKAMPQNQKKDEEASLDFGLFGLPDLPTVDLEVGKKVQLPTRADEEMLPFGPLPVEVDTSWTLRAINGDIAELDVTTESSGATEFEAQGGSGTISVLTEGSYTIFFNLTTKVPVSLEGYSASEINVDAAGQAMTFALNNEVSTTYEAAPAAAG